MENPIKGLTKNKFEYKLFYDGDSLYLAYLMYKCGTTREELLEAMREEIEDAKS
jgi:hypothetical protein